MFGKGKRMSDGAQAQALVLDKNAWDVGAATGETKACTYTLRVQFDDGSSVEIKRRVMHHDAAWVGVGELLPVRYDRTDRTGPRDQRPGGRALTQATGRRLRRPSAPALG